jgi:hypothetical protein
MIENVAWVIVAGFIFSLKVTDITWPVGTPVASFAGMVETTNGHSPSVPMKSSFLHPASRIIDPMAMAAKSFVVFICLLFE